MWRMAALAGRRAVEIRPGSALALRQLGALAYEREAYAEAAQRFEASVAICEDSGVYTMWGAALARAGDDAAAEAAYCRAIALEPTWAEACFNLGRLLLRRAAEVDADFDRPLGGTTC